MSTTEGLDRAIDHVARGNVAIAVRILTDSIRDLHDEARETELCSRGNFLRARFYYYENRRLEELRGESS